ncbi:hypothetical protein [Noviherbaspirillum sp.]|uniref:hypothetical protein n=1 Tax=Noviherbaspirillum sp. TaxID=1926288 RepID=UPI002D6FD39C|nr:hypothetical protein [Noviherbaspirillum sp.]HZW22972.1 hypothetical protein [Noviherbaspirillum sp.]
MEFLETPALVHGVLGFGNLLLIVSAVLYVSHVWFRSKAVGQWASLLAGLGAVASLLALAMGRIGSGWALNPLYEMIALFGALTVLIYLTMERVYRTRAAGAFVMLVVMGAVLFQIRLAGNETAISGGQALMLRAAAENAPDGPISLLK